MSIIDLRMEYKKQTGDNEVPLTHGFYDDVKYVIWLEEELIKLKNNELRTGHSN